MKNINITVENKRATVVGSPVIICGNSDYTVTFAFDSDWNVTGVRTARFVYVKDGKVQHEDVVFSGNTVAVPILSGIDSVKIGVFAGELRTTTPAVVRCGASILCGSGEVHEPTPDVYDQIMALFNDLAERGGFGATEAQAQQIAQNQADIAALVSGTKKAGKAASADLATNATNAGNANALGGQPLGYFAPKTSLTDYVKADGSNAWVSSVNNLNDFYTGITVVRYCENVPNDNWWLVISGGEGGTTVQTAYHLHGVETPKQRYCAGGTWSGWFDLNKDYLPLTGGTVEGNANVMLGLNSKLSDSNRIVFSYNGSQLGQIGFNGINNPIFMDTGSVIHTLLHTGNVAGYALPLDGNTPLEGNTLGISQNRGSVNADDAHVGLKTHTTKGDTENYRYLMVLNASQYGTADIGSAIFLRDCVNGYRRNYMLHHDGNSAKVHIGTSAPSDTSALWIDTSA